MLVHADTGWEHPDTDRYVRDVLPSALGRRIEIVSSIPELDEEDLAVAEEVEGLLGRAEPSAYIRWMLRKRMFPSRVRAWCTGAIKIEPLHDFMSGIGRLISAVGVRAGESRRRSQLGEWDMDSDGKDLVYPVWRPLIHWTEEDVIAYHHEHNLPINPLYTRGSARVGCWPCINSRKHEIALLARTDPTRIEVIRRLEDHISRRARERLKARGKAVHHADGSVKFRSFFSNPRYRADAKEAIDRGLDPKAVVSAMAPIDRVIEWAQNDGEEAELESAITSCTRWGVCDLPDGGSDE